MTMNDTVWQTAELTRNFLEGVRGAIPLAEEQIAVMLFLAHMSNTSIEAFLDLGCGDGILGHAVLRQYPTAVGVFADFSPPMLAAARKRMADNDQAVFIESDYGKKAWLSQMAPYTPFNLIVSGYSIHHQPDKRKKELYAELYDLLAPGGLFLNLEHVASHTDWGKQVFDDYFVNSLYTYHQHNGSGQSKEQVTQNYYNRPDKAANILALVETQCDWLREIGFKEVDCFLKIFELALFGGIK
ncbi:MAG: class I SAM-dependent methyltransferase [Candidatus Promineifilaceae bacterium]